MNILFLCTSNLHRSRTAEDYFKSKYSCHEFKSAGLSYKYVKKAGSTLCTVNMLRWSHRIYVFEEMHIQRIKENTGNEFLSKIVNLNIADEYTYFHRELLLLLQKKVQF